MNKLTKECIEVIRKEAIKVAHSQYAVPMADYAEKVLTTESIYSKAGLISLEDASDFFSWALKIGWYVLSNREWYNSKNKTEDNFITTAQLFQIYQEQKEK